LKFLEENHELVQSDEINKLFKKVIENGKSYWQLYPNFVSIVVSLLEIIRKSNNNCILKNLTEMLADLINHIDNNMEITPDEGDEVL
jgi:hypothetical protein